MKQRVRGGKMRSAHGSGAVRKAGGGQPCAARDGDDVIVELFFTPFSEAMGPSSPLGPLAMSLLHRMTPRHHCYRWSIFVY